MCLAHGHNAVMRVRLKPAAPWSRVKHSTTEPLCYQGIMCLAQGHNTVTPVRLKPRLIVSKQMEARVEDGVIIGLDKQNF